MERGGSLLFQGSTEVSSHLRLGDLVVGDPCGVLVQDPKTIPISRRQRHCGLTVGIIVGIEPMMVEEFWRAADKKGKHPMTTGRLLTIVFPGNIAKAKYYDYSPVYVVPTTSISSST